MVYIVGVSMATTHIYNNSFDKYTIHNNRIYMYKILLMKHRVNLVQGFLQMEFCIGRI